MEKCKVCGKEFKNISVHARTKHGMSKEEYEAYEELPENEEMEMFGDAEEVFEQVKKSNEERVIDKIFEPKESGASKPLSEFLQEFGLTESELRHLAREYVDGTQMPVQQKLKREEDFGNKGARELKDEKEVEVANLNIAEALQNKYGFKCVSVKSAKGTEPKKWVLVKR